MTIYDIAKEAGVSASSVSRVINNKPGINPETRARIKELLEKYHYVPNEGARNLVMQASKIVGILIADVRNVHHMEGAYYIEQELAKLGYCCIILNVGREIATKTAAIQILEKRRVEGAVMIGSSFQYPEIAQSISIHLAGVPVVMVNAHLELANVYGVLSDEMQGVRSCVAFLAGKGRKRLAFVRESHTPSSELKVQGFLAGMAEIKMKQAPVYETEDSVDGGYRVTQQIMDEIPDLEGIIYAVDLIAASGMRALADRGKKVPEQVAVIGIDNSIYGQISTPRLTSLDNQALQSGITAARILIDCLENRDTTHKIMLFSTLVEREST